MERNILKDIILIIDTFKNNKSYSEELVNRLKSFSRVCVWGTGEQGQKFIDIIQPYVKIDFVCDNNSQRWGSYIKGILCISPEELKKYKDDIILVITTGYHISITNQLEKDGYENIEVILSLLALKNNLQYTFYPEKLDLLKEKVSSLINICEDYKSKIIVKELIKNWFKNQNPDLTSYRKLCMGVQYFDEEIISFSDNETFVDIGAWDGDTIFTFLMKKKKVFNEIYAFELDAQNYVNLKSNISLLDENVKGKIRTSNIGIWDREDTVYYSELNTGSKIEKITEGTVGQVDSLDHLLLDKDVTFIKMDIEGAEIKAIKGAEDLIRTKRPKLAICIYHESEHLYEIPLLLKKLVPQYKIFIRHYSMDEYETVCYAIL